MTHSFKIPAACPNCRNSLMAPERQINGLDAIRISAKLHDTVGDLFLSQVYGSYQKQLDTVVDIEGSVIEGSCPHCHTPFPFHQTCECNATIFSLALQDGGLINLCSRNGCKRHSLEFETADDAFEFFRRQDNSGLY